MSDPDAQKKLIDLVGKSQDKALERAPRKHVGIIQIALIAAVICVVLGAALIYKDQPNLGFGAIGLGVIALVIAMILIRPQESGTEQQVTPRQPSPGRGEWSRITVKLPIPQQQLNQLGDALQGIRQLAQTQYSELLRARSTPPRTVNPERVRINVFLPDTRDAIYGEICGLYIPKGLHHGMTNDQERRIRFRPNEGLTGRVFTMEKAFGALRESANTDWQMIHLEGLGGRGDEGFQLTLEQVSLIDPELRWIVSFPLKVSVDSVPHTCGVLNLDGFTEALNAREMQSIYQRLKDEVGRFASELAKLAQCRVTIAVEEIKTVISA